MPARVHYHRHPGCGTTHNTACSGVQGWESSCFMVEIGSNKGQYACYHVINEPPRTSGITSATPSGTHSFVNHDGDTVAVSNWENGTTATVCTNGTTTVQEPDGTSMSVNDPFGGAPVAVTITPDGTRTTELPDGVIEVVEADGTVRTSHPDGSTVSVHPDGSVERDGADGPSGSGMTLDAAVQSGHLTGVEVVSTGENLGMVAVVVAECDGAVPFVYVPASILTPADPVTNQTLDTHPTVIDTSTPGSVEAEIPGACRNDPALPPAPNGDTGVTLTPTPVGDPTPVIGDIVTGVVDNGLIPADLVGTREDTVRTLDQVTRWLRQDATPEEVVAFLKPRIPGGEQEQEQTAQEITDWGARLVDKTRNLDKQIADVPEVPPGLLA